jgi:hypothetical protein
MSEESVLEVWDYGGGTFGGRLVRQGVEPRRYEGCVSAENVRQLAVALGEKVDQVVMLDAPVPWPFLAAASGPAAGAPDLERQLLECILRLNTGQRKRLLGLLATRPLEQRVQFAEHCNDLAAGAARTLLGRR